MIRTTTTTKTTKIKRYLLDTTLRDGEQAAGVCFSSAQKIEIAALLDEYGVHQIEAGIPAVSNEEKSTIEKIIANRKNAVISVWSRMKPTDIEHAIDVRPDIIHFSVPVSQIHIREKLRKDKTWVIEQLKNCLALIDKSGIQASVGFEDAFRCDMEFMLSIIKILLDNNITRVRLSDTVGVATPTLCRDVIKKITTTFDNKITLGIHAHNDLGMAVANTIEALKSGCLFADVTIGGIGERSGNCDLEKLVCAGAAMFDFGVNIADAHARGLRRALCGAGEAEKTFEKSKICKI